MALHTPSHFDGSLSQSTEVKDAASTVSSCTGKKFHSKSESSISPQFASTEKAKALAKAKAEKSCDPWNPADFERDASYFELTFGLPNEGENPYKIDSVTDEMLSNCFGEKLRSGYKLSNCTGIPTEDVLHLSQIVDGYDKPVNGVLALTFVKGVYAERILKCKVNWAQYASAKLRGQILQWEREKKGKPDGPPCVRKPCFYRPSQSLIGVSDSRPDVHIAVTKQLKATAGARVGNASLDDHLSGAVPRNDASNLSLERNTDITEGLGVESEAPSLLLEVLQSSILATKARKAEAMKDAFKIQSSLEALESAELEQPTVVANLSKECRSLEMDLQTTKQSITSAEKKCEEWQMELELEQNKEGQEFPDYVLMLEEQLKKEGEAIEGLKSHDRKIEETLEQVKRLLEDGLQRVESLASKKTRLRALAASVQNVTAQLDLAEESQKSEYKVLASVLLNPCPLLKPTYIPTTSVGRPHCIEVSSCPVCCFGFHCHNWIPASCGHAYHPSCLFPLIGGSRIDPKCLACGALFSNEWLGCWGLSPVQEDSSLMSSDLLRTVYGKQSLHLGKRRSFLQQILSVQQKSKVHAGVDVLLNSMEASQDLLSPIEDEWTLQEFLTPTVFNDLGRAIAEGGTDGKKPKTLSPSRKTTPAIRKRKSPF